MCNGGVPTYLQHFIMKLFFRQSLTKRNTRNTHLTSVHVANTGCSPMRKSGAPRCLPGWRWSPKSWPSKPTWWSCSHALFKWKHVKDEKSTPNTWKTCITCEWTTLGALMWVWFEKCRRRGWVFVSNCLSTLLRPRCWAETLSSRDTNGDLVRGQVSPCQIDRRKWPFTYANSLPVCWVTASLYITY